MNDAKFKKLVLKCLVRIMRQLANMICYGSWGKIYWEDEIKKLEAEAGGAERRDHERVNPSGNWYHHYADCSRIRSVQTAEGIRGG